MKWIKQFLTRVKELELYRQTITYEPVTSTEVMVDGRKYLMLASNNYLGLTHHPAVQAAAIEALRKHGTGSGGARLTTGTHPLFEELEKRLAEFKGTEAALIFNTGYMANVGVISALADKEDVIFSDEINHASIIDGCRLSKARTFVYRHADTHHLQELLANTPCQGQRFIISDGVFSMDGDIAPLDKITKLAEAYAAIVIVDDAHATGVIGPGGKGTAAYFGLDSRAMVQIGTLSKALGAEGGFVAGSHELIDFLKNKARSFIFSTALSPASIAAALAALKELSSQPGMAQKLRDNAAFMRTSLVTAGLPVVEGDTPIIALMVGEAELALKMTAALKEHGIIVSAIRPPTVPQGTSRLRLTVAAGHDQAELAAAAEKIILTAYQLGIIAR